jgi:hypothetical protein
MGKTILALYTGVITYALTFFVSVFIGMIILLLRRIISNRREGEAKT